MASQTYTDHTSPLLLGQEAVVLPFSPFGPPSSIPLHHRHVDPQDLDGGSFASSLSARCPRWSRDRSGPEKPNHGRRSREVAARLHTI